MKNNDKLNSGIEEIKDLRIKSGSETNSPEFKKSMFNGYDPKEVQEYIESMKLQHSNTLEAYQERIDEFTTFTEMLSKEKSDATASLASFTEKYTKMENDQAQISARNEEFAAEIALLKEKLVKYEESEEYGSSLRDKIDLTHENELLRVEIKALSDSRDLLAGENGSLKLQIESISETVAKLRTDNQELQFKHNTVFSQIRQTDMNVGMKASEFAQKQIFCIDRSADVLSSVISDLNELKEETSQLKKFINDTLISKSDSAL
ncbi:MAG: hypothetical protein ACYC5K_14250 [Saccharofermentanales bacterium]